MNTLGICDNVNFVTIIYLFRSIVTVLCIVVPIILMIMASVDMLKAVTENDDARKKTYGLCIKRFVYAFFFFFVPTVINLLFSIINNGSLSNYESFLCYNEATKENIELLKKEKDNYIEKKVDEANSLAQAEQEKIKNEVKKIQQELEKLKSKSSSNNNSNSQSSSNSSSSSNSNSSSSSSSSSSQKIMISAGHSTATKDTGTTNEAVMTRELALEIEKYLSKYVSVSIFNRDVIGEDSNLSSHKISSLEYVADCSDENDYRYSTTICPDPKTEGNSYDFSSYAYVLELHFNGGGGAGTFITVPSSSCSDSSTKKCMQKDENTEKIKKFATPIMKYMKSDTGISYNANSHNGFRDDFYVFERYVRVSSDYKTPASLMEVCAVDHDLGIYNKTTVAKAISHGIVEGLGLTWND